MSNVGIPPQLHAIFESSWLISHGTIYNKNNQYSITDVFFPKIVTYKTCKDLTRTIIEKLVFLKYGTQYAFMYCSRNSVFNLVSECARVY